MRVAEPRPDYRAGVTASLLAEAAFIGIVALAAILRGRDPWMVTRVPGSFLRGPEVVQPPGFVPDDVWIGLLVHLWLSMLVGVVYAGLLPRLRISPLAGGLITGMVLYVLGFWLLPQLFPFWLSPFWLPPAGRALQAVAHAAYGLVLGYAYRELGGRAPRIPPVG